MKINIIRTKLYIPSAPKTNLVRSSLIECIENNLHTKLTLISAPAGFGKSSLVSRWAEQTQHQVCWVSLSPSDNEPKVFIQYLVAALQTLWPESGQEILQLLDTSQQIDFPFMFSLISNIFYNHEESIVIVLDDYHLIQNQVIHDSLSDFISHLPSQVHLMILSRTTPEVLQLSKLLLYQELNMLTQKELSFNQKDIKLYLESAQINLTSENIHQLFIKTEGWPLSLQFVKLSLQKSPDVIKFIQDFSGSHHLLVDFLMDEVFNQLSEVLQEFLLKSSILETFNIPLCEVVTEMEQCQEHLKILEKNMLFLIPLDENREWYRYHHLFKDLLQSRLIKLDPALSSILHNRAAQWYQNNDLIEKAIDHYLLAKSYTLAQPLLETLIPEMINKYELQTIFRWFEQLPTKWLFDYPILFFLYVQVFFEDNQDQRAEELIQALEKHYQSEDKASSQVWASIYCLKSLCSLNLVIDGIKSHSTALSYAKKSLENVERLDSFVTYNAYFTISSIHFLEGDIEQSIQYMEKASLCAQNQGYERLALTTQENQASLFYSRGEYLKAEQLIQNIHQLLLRKKLQYNGTYINSYLILAAIYHSWNEKVKMQEAIDHLSSLSYSPLISIGVKISMIQLFLSQYKIEQARHVFQEINDNLKADSYHLQFNKDKLLSMQALLALYEGNVEEVKTITTQQERFNFPVLNANFQLTRAYLYFQLNQFQRAQDLLEQTTREHEVIRYQRQLIDLYNFQAFVLFKCQQLESACQIILKALTLAHPQKMVNFFVDIPFELKSLLKTLLDKDLQETPNAFVEHIIMLIDQAKHPYLFRSHTHHLLERLSLREREILHGMASGKSNLALSEELFISLNTLKTHIKNIFRKMEVKNRHEAVAVLNLT